MRKIVYTFDFLSPFSYLCWKSLNKRFSLLNSGEFELRPVAMAMVIREFQPAGPAEIPVKRDYLTKECLRISSLEKIPFQAPVKLPFISTDLLRAICALEESREWQWKLTDYLFDSIWQHKKDPEDIQCLLDQFVMPEELKELTQNPKARRILKQNTKEAIAEKLFGVPSFSVYEKGELKDHFWGINSLDHLELFLQQKLNIDHTVESDFKSLFTE